MGHERPRNWIEFPETHPRCVSLGRVGVHTFRQKFQRNRGPGLGQSGGRADK